MNPENSSALYAVDSDGIFKSTNGGDSWSRLNIGFTRPNFGSLAINPDNPENLYAGGSPYQLNKSTDSGTTWNAASDGIPSYAPVKSLAINKQNPTTLYAGTNGSGVYKSTNSGIDWSAANNGLGNMSFDILRINPQTPETVYAGEFGGGIFKSTDGGASWSESNNGLASKYVSALAINPLETEMLYAGVSNYGVYKSTDGGMSWSEVNSELTSTSISTILINPLNPEIVYAATYDEGVFKSTNGGESWSSINIGLGDVPFYALAFDPHYPTTIFAGANGGQVFKSTNEGANWSTIGKGLPDNAGISAFAIDPIAPQRIYVGTAPYGVWIYSSPYSSFFFLNPGSAANSRSPGKNDATKIGYAELAVYSGEVPYGTAVFSYRQSGVTVTEAGVSASPPTTHARIFIDHRSDTDAVPGRAEAGKIDVSTGIAVVNLGLQTANVTYTLYNVNGEAITSGTGTIEAGNHFARFIDQFSSIASGFDLPVNFQTDIQFASLEITSDQPLSIVALRMTTNQRNDVLYTTTPVADLTQSLIADPVFFAQFADGGGYKSSLILLNTSGSTETGTLEILDNNGTPLIVNQVNDTADSSFNYSIPSDGVFLLRTDGSPTKAKVGWVRLIPDAGTSTPVGSGLFSYNPTGVMVSESGVPATVPTTHARIYVDLSKNHNTGLALANVEASGITITVNAFQEDGITAVGTSQGPLLLAGNGHDARFANQLISDLPEGFSGLLDISSTTPFAALTVRSLNNERHEFLMTTFPVADVTRPAPSPVIFPQVADGGGYITQFILISANNSSSNTIFFYSEEGELWDINE